MVAWAERATRAVEHVGTPCYISAWTPVAQAVALVDAIDVSVPVRSWLSFKTHPLPSLAANWLRSGRGIEIVSERELVTVLGLDPTIDQILVNGVAKQTWLPRYPLPRLRVHLDSSTEVDALLPCAVEHGWRLGVRIHGPDECDARDPRFGGQFGMRPGEAVSAINRLRRAGVAVESVHFHLGQRTHQGGAYVRALDCAADVCGEAGLEPSFVDCGGALPTVQDPAFKDSWEDLSTAMRRAASRFSLLREIWVENGRFLTEASAALAVRVIDTKDRDECRYLICDGGRTNQALAADSHPHPLLLLPARDGPERLTTVCGPTCMTDDRLGRWSLPASIAVGDVIIWLGAGAYHLPWETRFSHGLCAVVWFDQDERASVARPRKVLEPAVQESVTP